MEGEVSRLARSCSIRALSFCHSSSFRFSISRLWCSASSLSF
jgi:hypothetical protein